MMHVVTAQLKMHRLWDDMPIGMAEALSPSPGPGATGAAMSDYLENETLDHLLSRATFTAATPLYYALFTTSPSDTGGGTEVAGGSYVRQSKTNNATEFPAASGGSKSNGTAVNFGTATGNWGAVGYMALIDNSAGGNYYFWGETDLSVPIQSGDSLTFPIGAIVFALD